MKISRVAVMLLATCVLALPARAADEVPWQAVLADRLPRFGQHNWIVIADAAYPSLSSDAVETIVTHAPQTEVLKTVLALWRIDRAYRAPRFRRCGAEICGRGGWAAGISQYRTELTQLMGGQEPTAIAHEEAIGRVIAASRNFHMLVLKTDSLLPYTSVYMELLPAYWNPEAEKRLRDAMAGGAADK